MTLMRWRFLRLLRGHPRLILAAMAGMAAIWALPSSWAVRTPTRLLLGWNVGVWLYVALVVTMMLRSTRESMYRRACLQDEGRYAILAMVVTAAVASLAAIVAELAVVKNDVGMARLYHTGLAGLTVLASWTLTHLMFALHYAHDFFYMRHRGEPGGLDFPGTDQPDYGDFVYFAFVIGTSGQTADVSISSSDMRRVGAIHCVLAFLFNTTLLALTINIAAGLI
jgi:uncharacterized membrane protein